MTKRPKGRPKKEPTKVMRVPVAIADKVMALINKHKESKNVRS